MNVPDYLAHYERPLKTIKPHGSSTLYVLETCIFDPNHNGGQASIGQTVDGKLFYQCYHDSCHDKKWHDAKQEISGNDNLSRFYNGHEKTLISPSGDELEAIEERQAMQETEDKGDALVSTSAIATDENKRNYTIKDAVLPYAAFRNLPEDQRTYIIPPWLWKGALIEIIGPRGVGKSNFSFGLFRAIGATEKFGPWGVSQPVVALYVDAEMMRGDTNDRLTMLDTPVDASLFIYSDDFAHNLGLPRAHLTNKVWRDAFKNMLQDLGVQVVFFDNIASMAPGIDENSKADWDPINQWFLELRFAGIAVIFVHHAGKSGAQRGTSGREDNLDIVIELMKPSDYLPQEGCRFIVHFSKHRIPQKDLHLIADTEFKLIQSQDGTHYTWAYNNPAKEAKRECLRMLSQGIDQKTISSGLGVTKGTISKWNTKFIGQGLITEKGILLPPGKLFLGCEYEN